MEASLYVSRKPQLIAMILLIPTCTLHSDYRGLKKRITAVRRAQEGQATHIQQDSSEPERDGDANLNESHSTPFSPEKPSVSEDSDEIPLPPVSKERRTRPSQKRRESSVRIQETLRDGVGEIQESDAKEDKEEVEEADGELGDEEDNEDGDDADVETAVHEEEQEHRGRSTVVEGNASSKSAPPALSISPSRRSRVSRAISGSSVVCRPYRQFAPRILLLRCHRSHKSNPPVNSRILLTQLLQAGHRREY